jgi:jumonji domain-containing protein 7
MEALLECGVQAQRDHLCSPVPRIDAGSLTPLEFVRSFVGPSKPCILLNAVTSWPAYRSWSVAHLRATAGDATCTLATTPTGRADAVERGAFALPAEEALPLAEALDRLEGASPCCGVPYLSAQNDSLRREFPLLAGDVGAVRTASEALGAAPDAVNLWISGAPAPGRATPVSSAHSDGYENLMTVLRGEKTFTLLPPMDVALLYKRDFPVARWAHDAAACRGGGSGGGCWALRPTADAAARVPWIEADPDAPDAARFPLAAHASPLRLTLRRGETLYLPALWLHQVGVGGGAREPTLAVNQWFDMAHGGVYCAQQMLLGLAPLLRERAAAAAAAAAAAQGAGGAPPLCGPLWRAFSARWRAGAPPSARDRAEGGAHVAALHAAFGRPVRLPLSLCGLEEVIAVSDAELAAVYLPLLWWLREGAARAPEGRRYLLGVSGPAGSGKTTLAAALVALGGALRVEGFPAAAALSMDA